MKQINLIIACLSVCVWTGCGGKQQKNAVEEQRQIFQIDSVDQQTGIQRMQASHINQEIACKGKKFQLKIDRMPAEDLPQVKSDMGIFLDNRITVNVMRDNGKPLFSKSFTKNDFAAHLSGGYLSRSVLEGVVYDDVRSAESKEITLAASVSYPMTDLYVPFVIVISQDGKMSLAKSEDMGELTPLDEE